VVDVGGRLELFEAKWTEVATAADAVNLEFVRKDRRERHRYPAGRGSV